MKITEGQEYLKSKFTKYSFCLNITLGFLIMFFFLSSGTAYSQVSPASVNYRLVVNEGSMDSSMPFPRGGNSQLSSHGFRFSCVPSHFSYDDPVVFPGQQGRAHLHMYFGNTLVDYNSTSQSILNSGASTCAGGTANRSSYWVPALINEDGETVLPYRIMNYYKSWASDRNQLRPIPNGLQILADDSILGSGGVVVARPGRIQDTWSGSIRVSDHDGLSIEIIFPDCIAVDSRGNPILTSPGGTSHVAYSGGGRCPASHPYLIPQLTQTLNWRNVPYESNWMLSSDHSYAEKGSTAHADYIAAWDTEALRIMVDCIRDGYRECGPEVTQRMENDFSFTPTGERTYRWLSLLDSANATPLGVWPNYVNISSSQTTQQNTHNHRNEQSSNTNNNQELNSTQPSHQNHNVHEESHGGNDTNGQNTVSTPVETPIKTENGTNEQDTVSTPVETPIKTENGTQTTIPEKVSEDRIITNENLNVRKEPAGKDVIKVIPAKSMGTKISSHSTFRNDLEWIKVEFDDSTVGYVAKKYTSISTNKHNEDYIRAEINRLLQQLRLLQTLLDQLIGNS